MMVGQLTTNAARYGARQAILDGSTNSTVVAEVQQFLVDTVGGIKASDVNVTLAVTPGAGNADPAGQLVNAQAKDVCKVTVSIPYKKVGYISGTFLTNANLRGSCTMRHE